MWTPDPALRTTLLADRHARVASGRRRRFVRAVRPTPPATPLGAPDSPRVIELLEPSGVSHG